MKIEKIVSKSQVLCIQNLNDLLSLVLWVFSYLTYSRFKWGRDNCFKIVAAS